MLCKSGEIITGPIYFAVAFTIGVFGYALGMAGGYLLSIGWESVSPANPPIVAALGGLCSSVWPAFLRRHNRRIVLAISLPLGAAVAGTVVALVGVPALTANPRFNAVFLGSLIGGASAMMILMPVPVSYASVD